MKLRLESRQSGRKCKQGNLLVYRDPIGTTCIDWVSTKTIFQLYDDVALGVLSKDPSPVKPLPLGFRSSESILPDIEILRKVSRELRFRKHGEARVSSLGCWRYFKYRGLSGSRPTFGKHVYATWLFGVNEFLNQQGIVKRADMKDHRPCREDFPLPNAVLAKTLKANALVVPRASSWIH